MKTYELLIASDHTGVMLKNKIIKHLHGKGISVLDYGPHGKEIVDYPDYAKKVVDGLLENIAPFGILICATGIGMSIAANRTSKIMAALCFDLFMAERARAHNDANILVLGAEVLEAKTAYQMVDKFLTTMFEGGRHSTRLAKIS